MKNTKMDDFEKLAKINHHRISDAKSTLTQQSGAVNHLQNIHTVQDEKLTELAELLATAESFLSDLEENGVSCDFKEISFDESEFTVAHKSSIGEEFYPIKILDVIVADSDDDFERFMKKHESYATKHNVNTEQSLVYLFSHQDLHQLRKFIDEDLRYKTAKCDKYDYMIAGTAGILGGLIDVLFVGAPGEGRILTEMSDKIVDNAVIKFASIFENEKITKMLGIPKREGPKPGTDPLTSAITYLEGAFKVNYDQATGKAAGEVFNMSCNNHHIKNIAHWPDLVGLFFSIVAQFSNTSSFIANGQIITMDTKTFQLHGDTFNAKIFCGFCNWIGHIMSDIAGSKGAKGRGSGIPIPFYGLLQFLDFGSFGKEKQTFAEICVKVFEKGYDFRHGIAMTIPVIVTELIIRIMHIIKRHFYHGDSLKESVFRKNDKELQRMLFTGHGTLCLIDAGDAALRSGGNMVTFLLRTNIIAWGRFGILAYKEAVLLLKKGQIDEEKLDAWAIEEYRAMIHS